MVATEADSPLDQEEEHQVVVVDEEEEERHRQAQLTMIHWPVIGAGCVAIWPATVPRLAPCRRTGVAMQALPAGLSHNLGKKAHREDVVVVGKSGLVPLMYCMMGTGMNIPWTMQVNCTSH